MWLSKRQQLQLKDVTEEMATWRKCWKSYVVGTYDGRVELKPIGWIEERPRSWSLYGYRS